MPAMRFPPQVLTPVMGEDGCHTGEWAVNIVMPDLTGLTVGTDKYSPVVPLIDGDGCVVGWVVKMVAVTEEE